jgi:hypothetical protein
VLARQKRRRFALQVGKLVHVVVKWRERAVPGVAQHLVEAAFFGLTGEEGNAQCLSLAQVWRDFRQHGDAAGNVKAADADRQSSREEWAGEIDGARKLVRLHADETDKCLTARLADFSDDPVRAHAPVGFVVGLQADFDVRT